MFCSGHVPRIVLGIAERAKGQLRAGTSGHFGGHEITAAVGTIARAAAGGHLEVLQWARSESCPWNSRTCQKAAEGGHLRTLRWARDHGCSWDCQTCEGAATRGHLEVLQWARANGAEWTVDTTYRAAAEGHVKLLQWALSQGCPWDMDATNTLFNKDTLIPCDGWLCTAPSCPMAPAMKQLNTGTSTFSNGCRPAAAAR
ncbi:unnamed protein product [Laminaria digitata]